MKINKSVMHLLISLSALLFLRTAAAQVPTEEIWIDVRSPQEYGQQHRDGAINIPFMKIMQQITDVTIDMQAKIRLYCTVGSRAEIAKQILESMGYQNVVNAGGLNNIKP